MRWEQSTTQLLLNIGDNCLVNSLYSDAPPFIGQCKKVVGQTSSGQESTDPFVPQEKLQETTKGRLQYEERTQKVNTATCS